MREYMANANVGDDVYGEDETVKRIGSSCSAHAEKRVCVCYAPVAPKVICSHYSVSVNAVKEYLVGGEYHTYRYEAGGAAVLGGIVPQTVAVHG